MCTEKEVERLRDRDKEEGDIERARGYSLLDYTVRYVHMVLVCPARVALGDSKLQITHVPPTPQIRL